MWQKFKSAFQEAVSDDTLYFSLLLVAIAVASFGLGRLTVPIAPEALVTEARSFTSQSNSAPSGIENTLSVATTTEYVASKSGTKYHLPWCPGAEQMKEENKIYFASKEEAEAAGYTPASNCKGL